MSLTKLIVGVVLAIVSSTAIAQDDCVPFNPDDTKIVDRGPVAQLVEQRIENPRVGSSILPQATRYTP